MRHTHVQARRGRYIATGTLRSQRDEVGATHFEVGTQEANVGIAFAAHRALPLHPKLSRFFGAHFSNQTFDKYLRTPGIQLVYHCTQLAVLRLWRCDDEGVGRRVCLNLSTRRNLPTRCTEAGVGATGRGAGVVGHAGGGDRGVA